jgi:large subunit ribosomal protein L9
MKVLLRRNVSKLGRIGEVVDVKPGFARNYLLPEGLAVEPTRTNLRAVELEKEHYLQELAKQRAELQAKAAIVQGKEITIFARANEEGRLYGSIGPAQIAAVLAEQTLFVEPRHVVLPEPIRQLDKYDVTLRFDEEVTATIVVWIVPVREVQEPGDESASAAAAPEAPEAQQADSPAAEEA